MRPSLILPLILGLGAAATSTGPPVLPNGEVPKPGLPVVPDPDDLDDGGYYPDPNSDTPWNGTVIDGPSIDWDLIETRDLWDADAAAALALAKRHPNYFTFYRKEWFYTSCSNPTNCQNYFIDNIQVHNDCNGDHWRETGFEENLCDKSFKSCGKTYVMGYTGREWSCARLRHFIREGTHHGRVYANLLSGGRKVGEWASARSSTRRGLRRTATSLRRRRSGPRSSAGSSEVLN
ncbi:hypothetical protein CMUS01_07042 [Colletotrichum musicola]|uniref:Secreted protein n=1 Tax=Colletotrichum musicola TaxID=2175873 RepID=A0A8H6NGM3_9PEZI|nr:hypothetical protein CMUS01_07042 [Colletotrichum musicola]